VKSPAKLSLWLPLAGVSAAVALVTAVAPHWLETIFGLDPDGGNGSTELLIVIASSAVSLLSWVRVAMRVRFAR
jgi:hypothetical protein